MSFDVVNDVNNTTGSKPWEELAPRYDTQNFDRFSCNVYLLIQNRSNVVMYLVNEQPFFQT